jgi:hypothetical protein
MPSLVTVLPFALVGIAMVVFGLLLNHQGTLSARKLDEQTSRTVKFYPAPRPASSANAGTSAAAAHHPVHS